MTTTYHYQSQKHQNHLIYRFDFIDECDDFLSSNSLHVCYIEIPIQWKALIDRYYIYPIHIIKSFVCYTCSEDDGGYAKYCSEEEMPLWYTNQYDITPYHVSNYYLGYGNDDDNIYTYSYSLEIDKSKDIHNNNELFKYIDEFWETSSLAHCKRSLLNTKKCTFYSNSIEGLEKVKYLLYPTYHLFLDCETTGLPSSKRVKELPKNPQDLNLDHYESSRLIQLSYTLRNPLDKTIITSKTFYIKHPSIPIEKYYNKDMYHICQNEGIPIENVLSQLKDIITNYSKSLVLICHNVDFDKAIIASELARLQNKSSYYEWIFLQTFCSMKYASKFMNKNKWPKLELLYKILYPNSPIKQTHYADDDVDMLIKFYDEMENKGCFLL